MSESVGFIQWSWIHDYLTLLPALKSHWLPHWFSGPLSPALVGTSRLTHRSTLPHTTSQLHCTEHPSPQETLCLLSYAVPTSSYLSGLSKHVFPSKKPFLTPTSFCESPQCPELPCHSTYCTVILGYLYMHGPKLTFPMHLTLCVAPCR